MSENNETEQQPAQQPDKSGSGPEAAAESPQRPRGGRVLGALALLVALLVGGAAAGAGYYFHLQLRAVERTAESRAGEDALSDLSQRLGRRADQLAERVETLSGRTNSQTENLAQFREELQGLRQDQRALTDRMDHFAKLAESRRYEWARSEAAYLASVAITRLDLHRDVDSALQALKEADTLLAGFGGRTVDARQGISRAIDALLDVDRPDLGDLSDRLLGLSASVGDLPLRGQPEPPGSGEPFSGPSDAEGEQGWRGAVKRAWDRFLYSLNQLVDIDRADDQPPLISPEQRFFLTQNLRLQLETARAAMVRNEPRLYRDSLRQAERWLSEFYDTDRNVVGTALEEVNALEKTPIRAELPDIRPMLAPLTGGGDA